MHLSSHQPVLAMACCPATITSAVCCRQLAPVLTAMLLQAQVAEPVPESLAAVKHGAAATLPVIFFCTHENWWAEPKDFRAWGAGVAQGFHMKIKTKKLGLAVGQVRLEGILPVHPDLAVEQTEVLLPGLRCQQRFASLL